jgi:hypothetical protein
LLRAQVTIRDHTYCLLLARCLRLQH